MLESTPHELAERVARDPRDPDAWFELARRVARTGEIPEGFEPRRHIRDLLDAWRASPDERSLEALLFSAFGWESPGSPADPGGWWPRRRRLGELAGRHHDTLTGLPLRVRVTSLGTELWWIPPGSFRKGTPSREDFHPAMEQPVHRVRLAYGFFIGRFPVTEAEYRKVAGALPGPSAGARHPVTHLSWRDAVAWCRELTARERRAGRFPEDWEYRLPSESEWEYAARGGWTKEFVPDLDAVAWWSGNSGDDRQPVGGKAPTGFGLQDVLGNVWEWTLDPYAMDFEATPRDGAAAREGLQAHRVLRGGDAGCNLYRCRFAEREWTREDTARYSYGFRLVASPCFPWAARAAEEQELPRGIGGWIDEDDDPYEWYP